MGGTAPAFVPASGYGYSARYREGAGLLEPSEWECAARDLSPWVHITSMFTNVANCSQQDVDVFLREVRRYVPQKKWYV